jgi:cysteinyl-tRNA synthetase
VLDKGKMSKSAGGFLTLQSLIEEGFDPLDYRYFLLGGHYRSQLQFSWPALEGAKNARKSLGDRVKALAIQGGNDGGAADSTKNTRAAEYLAAFDKALEDDLSTPRALAELWGLLKDNEIKPADALGAAFGMDRVLGLDLAKIAQEAVESAAKPQSGEDLALANEAEALIAERLAAKKAKNFAKADEIRDQLKGRGILLEDSPAGTTWRRI